ncbi:50S ribosomal protein L18 [Candidatus Dependentiae bacterium]|nr:50S ribosomal protein L18 [Candidatus Dependentiae bacterium]
MANNKRIKKRVKRRLLRVREGIKRVALLPRVSVFRSAKHMYAQLIDVAEGKTLASCSSLQLKEFKGDKKVIAHEVGKELAQRAKKVGATAAVFDRGAYLYHGRVEALAQGLREGGLKI